MVVRTVLIRASSRHADRCLASGRANTARRAGRFAQRKPSRQTKNSQLKEQECVEFLQWALPRLHLSWPGFRKVHRRCAKGLVGGCELGLARLSDYRRYLERHTDEWGFLELLCSITPFTISRPSSPLS